MVGALVASVVVASVVGQVTFKQPDRGTAIGVAATVLAALLAATAIWWSVWQANASRKEALAQRRADHRLAVLRDLSDLQDLGLGRDERRVRARTLLVALSAPELSLPALEAWTDFRSTSDGEVKLRRIVLTFAAGNATADQYDALSQQQRWDYQVDALRLGDPTKPGTTPWSQETEAATRTVLSQG